MAAVVNGHSNTYEEARKQRLDENKKRFQDLGILDISKSLSKLSSPEKKAKQRQPKAANTEFVEPRRSSRARTTVSYQDDLDIDLRPMRKRGRVSSSWASYVARPLDEIKLASYQDRGRALRAAEEFQASLQSGNPSFVKSMVRSHVYSCFWLGLPTQFCKNHLPKKDVDMTLEDEDGLTWDAKLLGSRTGLSGGWRGYALDHKLDDGDAVVFELVDSDKFKLYTFKVSAPLSSRTEADVAEENGSAKAKNASEDPKKRKSPPNKKRSPVGKKQNSKKAKASKVSKAETSKPENKSASEVISSDKNSDEKNGVLEENDGRDESAAVETEVESLEENKKLKKQAGKPRKKPAEMLFRRRSNRIKSNRDCGE